MNTKRIFEIPIYSSSEKSFNRKWSERIQKAVNKWVNSGWQSEKAKSIIADLAFPRNIWKYSQIIGYLVIDISKTDVWFDIYAPLSNRGLRYDRTAKFFPQRWDLCNTHFRIEDKMTNMQIAESMNVWINLIWKKYMPNWLLDLSIFQNTINYIDFLRLISDL